MLTFHFLAIFIYKNVCEEMNRTNNYIIFAFVALMLVSVVCFGVFFALVWHPLLFAYIGTISITGAYILTRYDIKTHR